MFFVAYSTTRNALLSVLVKQWTQWGPEVKLQNVTGLLRQIPKIALKRACDRILPGADEPSQRQPPGKGFPEWAVQG